ncbi:hypothetical protein HPB47_007532, partial [Ixodes persulcatus]
MSLKDEKEPVVWKSRWRLAQQTIQVAPASAEAAQTLIQGSPDAARWTIHVSAGYDARAVSFPSVRQAFKSAIHGSRSLGESPALESIGVRTAFQEDRIRVVRCGPRDALEQEKHALRRKLDSVSGESDGRLSELQADLAQARQQLAEQQALLRSLDRERGAVVHEMADQNQRLAQELKAARRAEDQAASQYRSLREQLSLRRSSLDDHVSQLEGLREEITLLSDRKAELERRISALVDERESLSLSLEESGDRILLLEKQRHDYEAQIRNQQRDMEELRVANVQLQERLDAAQRLRTSSPLPGHSLGHRSLFNEIEMSSSSSADDDAASTGRRSRQLSQLGSSSAGFAADLDEIECDECELGSEEDK